MKAKVILLLILLSGCNFPKDAENSFQNAQQNSLKVGVVNNAPYAFMQNGAAQGSEIEILKSFAKNNNLQIQFIEGSESTLIEKLEKFKIHIVSGGFDKKTVWKKHAGTSATYDSKHVFLIPKGENKLLHSLETYILQNHKK